MKDKILTLLKQVNAKELKFAKFKVYYDDKKTSVIISKGKKLLEIKYNSGSDLYDLQIYKNCTTEPQIKQGYYAEMLQPFIQDFFKFEYVMDSFFKGVQQ